MINLSNPRSDARRYANAWIALVEIFSGAPQKPKENYMR